MHSLLTFLVAAGVTAVLVWWRNEPGLPWWTAVVGAVGAGFLAAIVVVMRETIVEDLVKALIFTVIGVVLLFQGIPAWMAWPILVGPWVGLVFNGGGKRASEPGAGRDAGD